MKKLVSLVLLAGAALTGCAMDPSANEGGDELGTVTQLESTVQRENSIDWKRALSAFQFLGAETSLKHYTARPGARKTYADGHIYYGDEVNAAKVVYGSILSKYTAKGGPESLLGYPITDEGDTYNQGGRYNNFEFGSIHFKWGAPASYETHGCHRNVWSRMGWETGPLGYPTSDEFTQGNQKISRFEYGNLYYEGGSSSDCAMLSWPVLTAASSQPAYDAPRISKIVIQQTGFSDTFWVRVEGSNFVPGENIKLTFNAPNGVSAICSSFAVKADGTIYFDQANKANCSTNVNFIKKVNGRATLQALGSQGSVAAASIATSYGVNYTGAQ